MKAEVVSTKQPLLTISVILKGASRWLYLTEKVPCVIQIAHVISLLQKQHPPFTYEVIVVDDGSKDKTTEVIILNLFFWKYVPKSSIFT